MFFRRSRYGPDEFRHMGYVPPEAFEEAQAAGRSSRAVRLLRFVGVLVLMAAASGGAWFALGRPLPPPGTPARTWLERVLPGSAIYELAGPERGPPTSVPAPGDGETEGRADTAALRPGLPAGERDEPAPEDAATGPGGRAGLVTTPERQDSSMDRPDTRTGPSASEPAQAEPPRLRERAQPRAEPPDPDAAIPRAVRDSLDLRLAHAEVLRELGRYGDAALVVQGTSDWIALLIRTYGVLPFLERMRARSDATLQAIRETCRSEGEQNCP